MFLEGKLSEVLQIVQMKMVVHTFYHDGHTKIKERMQSYFFCK